MSCALNALLPKHKLNNEKALYCPDKHGGFEMGTWRFATYLSFFEDIVGTKDCYIKEHYKGLNNTIQIFTPEAHKIIVKELKRILNCCLPKRKQILTDDLLSKREKTILQNWCGIGRMDVYPKKNPLHLSHRKWYKRLLDIFESEEAVFYCI